MKPLCAFSLAVLGAGAFAILGGVAGLAQPAELTSGSPHDDAPKYDSGGKLLFPADYREWVFLSSGLNMSYNPSPAMAGMDMFGNTFAPRAAYAAFKKTGVWPDKTVLMLENRGGATKGSINKKGQFQTTETMGVEAHVKDTTRFKGGWAFFAFDGDRPAQQIPTAAACYSCHRDHAAADTTFVQFYPTLLPIATALKTLSPSYLADEAASK
jgi:hypothetical protein